MAAPIKPGVEISRGATQPAGQGLADLKASLLTDGGRTADDQLRHRGADLTELDTPQTRSRGQNQQSITGSQHQIGSWKHDLVVLLLTLQRQDCHPIPVFNTGDAAPAQRVFGRQLKSNQQQGLLQNPDDSFNPFAKGGGDHGISDEIHRRHHSQTTKQITQWICSRKGMGENNHPSCRPAALAHKGLLQVFQQIRRQEACRR
ncbi:MAG: hypothetical protein VKO00_11240 [Cyanobacteriota bacterium]|nr:hypothetical protein [Cyanobacteriota bacterium]